MVGEGRRRGDGGFTYLYFSILLVTFKNNLEEAGLVELLRWAVGVQDPSQQISDQEC